MKLLSKVISCHVVSFSLVALFFVPVGVNACENVACKPAFRALVFSKTQAFQHDSVPEGIAAIEKLGREHRFAVDASVDSNDFTAENLARYAVVIFNNTSGTLFNEEQRKAFKGFIRNGGGYVGIHAATDTEYDWPWYGQLVGAYFSGHPEIQEATILVEDREHPSTRHLSDTWVRTDEWYNFRETPRDQVTVLLSLMTDTFRGSGMPDDHPIAWCHEFDGGRAWYTGGGHTKETFTEEKFVQHLLGGILWAAGKKD